MAAASSSSSSATIDGFEYDVFLSFRGEDTRYDFTGSLWKALVDKGIRTFFDEEDIHKGDEITPLLLRSIEQSKMALVVLSKNYASSAFCLNELSHIIECMKENGRLVWPIFHDVEPSDVRKLQNSYGEAMAKHETNSRYSTNMLEKWKIALHQVANLAGTHFKKGEKYLYKFIEEIVDEVSTNIKPLTLHVADNLVGLGGQMKDVILRLDLGSVDEVRMVGIHGSGGIGKTTLAVAVYNSIANQFQGSCYLESVRENFVKNGLTYLQKIILSKTVGEKKIELTSSREGITIIKKRLGQKKVLLLLDDVDELEQLEAIAGSPSWFGRGSRVIITTRNTRLLTCHKVESTYEVKLLNNEDAFELLRQKAIRTSEVPPSYKDVLNRVLTYASGIPLALEVMGSHLFKKTVEECKYVLDHYEKNPDPKIQTILKVSFVALDREEKRVFLDIACVFKGQELEYVEKILHAHYGDSKKHLINVLVEKSLIKVSESGQVTLHDLIADMGEEIVRQESPDDPGRRSRLWLAEDIVQVLEENQGTSKIEIIYFQSKIEFIFHSIIEVKWNGEAFKKMKNLRTLIIKSGISLKSPKHLPNSLRVLEWWNYSGDIPSEFYPKKLVICKFFKNSTSFMREDFFKKKFEFMRILVVQSCDFLTQIPDISGLLNLEEFSLEWCVNLIRIDDSVGLLDKLRTLRLIYCKKLNSIPPLKLSSLEELRIFGCQDLESLPPMVDGFLGKLRILHINNCSKLLPPNLNLSSLEELHFVRCGGLDSFPLVVDGILSKLKKLSFIGCHNLKSFPPLELPSLESLKLKDCPSLKNIPSLDGLLGSPKFMEISNCNNIRSIPPLKLTLLEEFKLSNCDGFESFSPVVDGVLGRLKVFRVDHCRNLKSIPPLKLPLLEELTLSCCHSLESFPHVMDGLLGKLKVFCVDNCKNLKSIPPLKLPLLEELTLSYCDSLEIFPLMTDVSLGKLKRLTVKHCKNLKSIPSLKLPLLEELTLSYCDSLESFPLAVDGLLGKLKVFHVYSCKNLKSIPPLKLPLLEELKLSCCDSLESFPHVMDGLLGKLKLLSVHHCKILKSIPPLKLPLLEELTLSCCDSLESFPLDGLLGKLKSLEVHFCRNLKSFLQLKLASLEYLGLSYCGSLESFLPLVDWWMGKLKVLQVMCCRNHRSIPTVQFATLEELHLSCDCFHLKELPFSFQDLTCLQELRLQNCGIVQFPTSSIVAMSELVKLTIMDGRCIFPNQDEGEEKGSSMQSSRVEFIKLWCCDLSDESLAIGLKWFANMKELYLSFSNFTTLPECIKNCHFLWKLVMDDCEKLEEIKGIPPKVKTISAFNCNSLNSLSKSKLLNHEVHKFGNTNFILPGEEIPNWFDREYMQGLSVSFWFRNKFPAIALCAVSPMIWINYQVCLKVTINGMEYSYEDDIHYSHYWPKMNHLWLFHMQNQKFNADPDRKLLENKWNHVVVEFEFGIFKSGIHVLKEISRMEDIRFDNPENDE